MSKFVRFFAIVGCLQAAYCHADGPGLQLAGVDKSTPRWQARLELTTGSPQLSVGGAPAVWRQSLRLQGDYQLGQIRLGETSFGQIRLTSGVWHGPRSLLLGSAPGAFRSLGPVSIGWSVSEASLRLHDVVPETASTWPYLGLGYSGALLGGALGLSADLGLAAQNPNALRMDRLFDSSSTLDGVLRDMRLTPMLRLGMSYRF